MTEKLLADHSVEIYSYYQSLHHSRTSLLLQLVFLIKFRNCSFSLCKLFLRFHPWPKLIKNWFNWNFRKMHFPQLHKFPNSKNVVSIWKFLGKLEKKWQNCKAITTIFCVAPLFYFNLVLFAIGKDENISKRAKRIF